MKSKGCGDNLAVDFLNGQIQACRTDRANHVGVYPLFSVRWEVWPVRVFFVGGANDEMKIGWRVATALAVPHSPRDILPVIFFTHPQVAATMNRDANRMAQPVNRSHAIVADKQLIIPARNH